MITQIEDKPAPPSGLSEIKQGESYRLAVLRSYGMLDSSPEASFDSITRLAARVFQVPTVLISLVDEERQWFKSRVGLDVCETTRDVSFCDHVITDNAPLVVTDATADARFANNPLVTGEPHIRFYAGAPLRAPEGVILGTLCLIDSKAREFSREDMAQLCEMADLVVDRMKLQHDQKLCRSLIEGSSDLMAVFDSQGNMNYQNSAFARFFGEDFQDFSFRKMMELVHPDDQAILRERYAEMKENKRDMAPHRFRFRHSDGSWRVLESYVRYQLDDPNVNGIVCVIQDVSQEVQVQEKLNSSEHRFEATFEQSSVGMAMVAPDGRLLRINQRFSEMTGIEKDRLSQHHYSDIIPANQQAESAENKQRLLRGEEKSLSIERKLVHADGHSRWTQFIVSRVTDGAEDDYLLVQLQDIEARRAQEERLRLLESVAVHANDAILITAAEPIEEEQGGPRILYANEAYCKMSGYTLEEVLGKTPRIMQGPDTDPASRDEIRQALKNWQPVVCEILNYTKSGTPFWVELSIVPVSNEKGWFTHWVSLQRDITARKETESALMRTNEEADRARQEAETANRAKSEFLSRMSHELRTPLNAILGFGQLLELEEQNEANRQSTAQILKAGRHLLELINEVLDISRIESGRIPLSLEPISVSEIARETLDMVSSMAAQYGIGLRGEALLQSQVYITGDRRRLKQILLNLLSNAIKYNRKNGVVTLSIEFTEDDECVRLCVTDEGIGIAPEKRARLWIPFDRLDAENTSIEGTGIGLALSHRLAQAMDGRLDLRPEEQGSTFWIELPRATPLSILPSDALSDVEPAHSPAVSTRWVALYIEDNRPNIQLMQGIMARRPEVRLLTSFSGELGVELALQHKPDVVLLDLHLPDINGDEVLRRLRQNPTTKHIPIVMISADATPGQIERLLQAGANHYLSKPFDLTQFWSVFDDSIAQSERSNPAPK